ncbi:TRAP transporter substrate-binding protein [Marinomonas mediterranea]|jgi:tripartite ATP-independent periplasmic transporter solute receptor, DctP family|uniref:TRAP dicarboxylate transporter, DctP subunit n=1 Tax=Marinomonas mediterranea (strain ATCC 700492 / JCM 21426 / NBRC 103028 / MMB-1) TaxID=717774 RepID=F2JVB1_MARM1|nr:TRAP transporter substrate-binding protein [Marinomonas mediterranea]ADZ89369.1 TRAP dicarboxylate transporter, DctP subunit [Marinomonas mediterranea MMB-1]WCN07470.1 DctP family TRAP transporter solute-binding subunit [Marinomonas mediterranea]WCN11566.1 DctP family TRAP transporter solute-binding subunit [Marinomonas mediterranea]WCN15633.1 DctP family TRAP transporter solute-binding subunit [Marinomonas mediterranea MMB-1]
MIKKTVIQKVSGAILVAATAAAVSTSANAEWKGWNIHNPGYPVTTALESFIDDVEAKTDGRVAGRVYNGAVLGNQADSIQMLQIGAIQFAEFNLGPIGAIVPEANVVSLPFIFKSVDHMHRVMDGPVGDELSAAMEKHGIKSLAWYDSGARSFYNTEKPIEAPSDLDGMKFRVMNNELYVGMVEALGGNATPMAYAEIYQSLKTGVVDGAENNWPSYESSNHFEVAGYYSLTEHLILPECVCVSVGAWNQLSADDQVIVKKAARESAELQRKLWAERDKSSREKVLASGVVFNEISNKAPFQNAMKVVYEKAFQDNPTLKPLVEKIQSVD